MCVYDVQENIIIISTTSFARKDDVRTKIENLLRNTLLQTVFGLQYKNN